MKKPNKYDMGPALELLNFSLSDTVSGKRIGPLNFREAKVFVIAFICNHCPYVKHIANHLSALASEYHQTPDVRFLAISSNDVVNYPEDSPALMQETAKELNYPFVYLYDESQQIAQKFNAACTPEFYVFSKDVGLCYHGRYDESSPGNGKEVNGSDLKLGIASALKNTKVPDKSAIGCSIKWIKN